MSMIMSRENFLDALIRDAKPEPEWPEVDLDEQAARFASVPKEERATWEPPPPEFLERVLKGLREL